LFEKIVFVEVSSLACVRFAETGQFWRASFSTISPIIVLELEDVLLQCQGDQITALYLIS
jgi:hypothetical protein